LIYYILKNHELAKILKRKEICNLIPPMLALQELGKVSSLTHDLEIAATGANPQLH
jgi:hypothetical protein